MSGIKIPCKKCGQVNHGQHGEYPCPMCGLPIVHDESRGSGLAMKRRIGDGIVIDGGRITIRVAEIKGKEVKLRIKAPEDTLILREELVDNPPPRYLNRSASPAKLPLDKAIEDLMSRRREHLEEYAARFVQQMGPVDAADYELVEEKSPDFLETRWFFRPKGSGGKHARN